MRLNKARILPDCSEVLDLDESVHKIKRSYLEAIRSDGD